MYFSEQPPAGNWFSGIPWPGPSRPARLAAGPRLESETTRLGAAILHEEESLYNWLIKNGMSPSQALKLVQGLRKVPSSQPGPGPNAQGSVRVRPGYGPMKPLPKGHGFSAESIYRKKRGW